MSSLRHTATRAWVASRRDWGMTVSLSELDLAWALLGQQRYAEAARQAEGILARFPNNVSAIACHAMALWKDSGDSAQPLLEIGRAVELAPDVASLRHN